MQRVIDELRARNQPVPVPLELPDMDDIIEAEEQILLALDGECRQFLLTVSDVVYGAIEPVTVTDPHSNTYLPEVAAMAWSLGVSREYIPICEDRGGYYCATPEGEIVEWRDGDVLPEPPWRNIWEWAEQVWLG